MFRRQFLQLLTVAGVSSLTPLEAMKASQSVTYVVKGFSCITCATGLDTMLSRQKGVISSKSTYPEGKVTVSFDPGQISEHSIVQFITDLGFKVEG
ncbi:MAG TPA: heavy-metal-associated domain-containing protein [Acidobacteriaceae bacterium]|nr:heavy-metal-associated domain-containing protein [Acidobacteriaceae bacterium]